MASFNIAPLFPTPVYEEVFQGNVVNVMQREVGFGLESTIFNEPNSQKLSNQLGHDINTGGFDGDWLAEKACLGFISTLNDAVVRYCQYIGFPSTEQYDPKRLEYDRKSWINTFKKNSYAHIHSHSTADISGVYYYQTTGKDGNLFFETPVRESTCTDAWVHLSNRCNAPAEVGKMILFPGWLNHGVSQNFTNDDRISISWNIKFKKIK
tara:strand:- start:43 stop:669 length:627 start_codon:yes stop_codon:yes gene_type:complete